MSAKTEKKVEKKNAKAPAKGKGKNKPGKGTMLLPGYLQAFLAGCQLVVLAIGLLVAGLSYAAGSSWTAIALRAGVSIFVTGIFMWMISYRVVHGSIDALFELKQAAIKAAAEDDSESSVEKQV